MISYEVPFYPNMEDNTHCFQACMKMVLKYFLPGKSFSWNELDRISAKEKGMWTWTMAGILWLKKEGFEVLNIEPFDYNDFALKGKKYLVKIFGQKVADVQEKNSILENEQNRAKEFVKEINSDKRIPKLEDIKNLLEKGYLIIICLNSAILSGLGGYAGHFVVVKGFDEKSLILHNPGGCPGKPNQKVSFALFEKAWAYPNEKAKNIIAIKK